MIPTAFSVSFFIASTLWSSHLATFGLSLRAPAIRRPARNTRRMRMPSIKITDLCSQQISLLAAFSSSSCFFCYSCKIEVIAVASSSDRSAVKPKLIGSLLCSCSSVLYVYCARMYRYYIGCCTVILSSRVCFCHKFFLLSHFVALLGKQIFRRGQKSCWTIKLGRPHSSAVLLCYFCCSASVFSAARRPSSLCINLKSHFSAESKKPFLCRAPLPADVSILGPLYQSTNFLYSRSSEKEARLSRYDLAKTMIYDINFSFKKKLHLAFLKRSTVAYPGISFLVIKQA